MRSLSDENLLERNRNEERVLNLDDVKADKKLKIADDEDEKR